MDTRRISHIFILVVITIQLNAQSVGGTVAGPVEYCSPSGGGSVSLTGYNGTIINWEQSVNGGTSWASTGNFLATQGFNALTQTTCYRAIVKDGPLDPDTSSIWCVTIHPESDGGIITGDGTFCVGNDTLLLTSSIGNVIRWQYSINNGSSWTNVANTSDTLIFSNITQNTIYEAVVQSNPICNTDTSSQGSIVISPTVAGIITGGGEFCEQAEEDTLFLSEHTGNVVAWCYSSDSGNTWETINDSSDTLLYSNITESRIYKALVKLGECSIDTSSIVDITINNSIAGTINNQDLTIEYNTNGGKLFLIDKKGTVKDWLISEDNGINWSSSNVTDSTYKYSNLITTTQYLVIVQKKNCLIDSSNIVTINVLPKAVADVSNFFSPNGDGYNDYWYIKGIENFPNNEVIVFNNNGSVVFSKTGYTNDWPGTYNGKELPDGTYFYIVKVAEKDILLKGTVNILRSN